MYTCLFFVRQHHKSQQNSTPSVKAYTYMYIYKYCISIYAYAYSKHVYTYSILPVSYCPAPEKAYM